MNDFILNERLANDTYAVAENDDYYVRLNKNSLIPWLILVPKTHEVELFACSDDFKKRVRHTVDSLAVFSQNYFAAEKMNVATIGNVVSQLHIHIVVRKTNDFAWPDPVWGKTDFIPYHEEVAELIISDTQAFLKGLPKF